MGRGVAGGGRGDDEAVRGYLHARAGEGEALVFIPSDRLTDATPRARGAKGWNLNPASLWQRPASPLARAGEDGN